MSNVNKMVPIVIVFLIITSCTGNREMVHTLGYYDTDKDFKVNRDEFNTVFRNEGDFDSWDADRDSRINESEWNAGFNEYSSSYPYEEKGLFDDWDTNGDTYVDNNEFSEGVFGMRDNNNDGFIDQDEWDKYEKE